MPGASGLRKVFKGQICDHHIYKCLQAASERWQETFQPQSTVLLMFLFKNCGTKKQARPRQICNLTGRKAFFVGKRWAGRSMLSTYRCADALQRQELCKWGWSISLCWCLWCGHKFVLRKVRASELVSEKEEKSNPVQTWVFLRLTSHTHLTLRPARHAKVVPKLCPHKCRLVYGGIRRISLKCGCYLSTSSQHDCRVLFHTRSGDQTQIGALCWILNYYTPQLLRSCALSQCWRSQRRSRRSGRWNPADFVQDHPPWALFERISCHVFRTLSLYRSSFS